MSILPIIFKKYQQGALLNYLRWFTSYKSRVNLDTGVIQDDTITRSIYKMLQDTNLYDNTLLLVTAEGGLKTRVSGVEQFVTKAYDLGAADAVYQDATQTTESSQPFLGGRIAPNEKLCLKSVTGANKTLVHDDIVVSGTYTIIKVQNETGKTQITFTEVSSGTLNSIAWTGKLYLYAIYSGTIDAEKQVNVTTQLRAIFPEVESVVIGTQTWATSNFEAVATPMGNVIQEMQAASAVEKIPHPIDFTTNYAIQDNATIENLDTFSTIGPGGISKNSILDNNKWYKLNISGSTTSGNFEVYEGTINRINISGILNGTFSKTVFFKTSPNYNPNIYLRNAVSSTTTISTFSVQKLGWADSQELYDGLIAQGYTAANAAKEAAMWCYYNNDAANGAIYSKLYNWFAVKLLQNDIDAYNAVNPTTPYGWHVPADSEQTTLQDYLGDNDADELKQSGTSYWTDGTGTNETGFTALPAGYRKEDGTFAGINTAALLLTSDSLQPKLGGSLRILKD